MKGFKAFIRPFEGTTKKCENKNFSSFFILPQLSKMHGAGRVKYFAKFTGNTSIVVPFVINKFGTTFSQNTFGRLFLFFAINFKYTPFMYLKLITKILAEFVIYT